MSCMKPEVQADPAEEESLVGVRQEGNQSIDHGSSSSVAANAPPEDDDIEDLAYSAQHLVAILIPVTITMLLVVLIVRLLLESPSANAVSYSPLMVYKEKATDSTGERLGGAVLNALIFVGVIIVFTVILVILYKYRCMKVVVMVPLCDIQDHLRLVRPLRHKPPWNVRFLPLLVSHFYYLPDYPVLSSTHTTSRSTSSRTSSCWRTLPLAVSLPFSGMRRCWSSRRI